MPQDGGTPLHWAADKGQVEMVRLLLERGAKREAITKVGRPGILQGVFGRS